MATNKLPLAQPAGAYPDSYHQPEFGNHAYTPSFRERTAWYRSQRFRIFIITVLLSATLGLIFDFSRPAIYRSSTVLLTVTPDQVGAEAVDPSLQHALIQKNLLRARQILDASLKQLNLEGHPAGQLPSDSAEFQKMLSVSPLEGTNLVEVSAEGHNAAILPTLLNTLAAAYGQFRSDTIAKAVAETSSALLEQQLALEDKVNKKRKELDQFRANNNILSLGRDENEVFAKLTGLTQALNTAMEKRVTSKAELDAIQAAAAKGQALVAPGNERAFADLQQRQRQLKEKLIELDNRYTRDYMALYPEMKSIPEQLAAVEKQIANEISSGKSVVLTTALRDYQAAKNAEYALQRQLDNYKQTALEFSSSFSAHEAKKEELLQLEEHYRTIQQDITELHVEQQQKYPQIKVIEPAYLESHSIRPLYWRDAGIVLAASVLLGLLAIWMYEFLRRSRPQSEDYPPAPNYVTVIDPRLASSVEGVMPQPKLTEQAHSQAIASLAQTSNRQLPNTPAIKEIGETEIKELFSAADLPTQQLIALLLSGVRPDELGALTAENFIPPADPLSEHQLKLNTVMPRTITIPGVLQLLLTKTHGTPQWLGGDENLDTDDFNAMINCAAVDAGLDSPSNIDCDCLHQSYICFLIRSGIKLSELSKIVGQLPPKKLTQYGELSPPGAGLPVSEINALHPALQAAIKGAQYN